MAQKIKPNALRLGITGPWQNRWFFKKEFRFFLEEDHWIRAITRVRTLSAGIDRINIERTSEVVRVIVRANRPGLIIGRGGKGIEELREALLRKIKALRRAHGIPPKFSLHVDVEEFKRTDVSASATAQQIAFDIEKRVPYRTVMKRHLESLKQNREVLGAKIRLAGRLNGAEISRRELLAFGRMPLQNLRANIDYGEATAFNTYGTIGVKVWLYKGEIF